MLSGSCRGPAGPDAHDVVGGGRPGWAVSTGAGRCRAAIGTSAGAWRRGRLGPRRRHSRRGRARLGPEACEHSSTEWRRCRVRSPRRRRNRRASHRRRRLRPPPSVSSANSSCAALRPAASAANRAWSSARKSSSVMLSTALRTSPMVSARRSRPARNCSIWLWSTRRRRVRSASTLARSSCASCTMARHSARAWVTKGLRLRALALSTREVASSWARRSSSVAAASAARSARAVVRAVRCGAWQRPRSLLVLGRACGPRRSRPAPPARRPPRGPSAAPGRSRARARP